MWNDKGTRISKSALKKESKGQGFIILDINTY